MHESVTEAHHGLIHLGKNDESCRVATNDGRGTVEYLLDASAAAA
jgi:hypothetical protein